ncbi:MAG: hypothetical protein V1826_02085 [bacterium]
MGSRPDAGAGKRAKMKEHKRQRREAACQASAAADGNGGKKGKRLTSAREAHWPEAAGLILSPPSSQGISASP